MIFITKTLKYLKKSFFAVALTLIAPSVLLGFFTQPFLTINFLPLYYKNPSYNFLDSFYLLVSDSAIKSIYPYILIFFALLLCLSYALGMIEKHFKTGNLGMSNPIRSINNTILSAIQTLPLMVVILVFIDAVQAGLIALIGFLFRVHIVASIWITIVSFLVFALLVAIALIMFVWAMVMQIYGYSFADAFVETMRTISKRWVSLFFGFFFPLLLLCLPTFVINIVGVGEGIPLIVVSTLTYLFASVYSCAYVYVAIYDLNGLLRRDERHLY